MYSRRGYEDKNGRPVPPPGYGGTVLGAGRTYLSGAREPSPLPPPAYPSHHTEARHPRYPLDTAGVERQEPNGVPPFGFKPPAGEKAYAGATASSPGEDDILLGALLLLLLGENQPGCRETMGLLGYLLVAK